MKNAMNAMRLTGLMIAAYLMSVSALYADTNPIYEKLSRQGIVKIYVDDFTDGTKDKKIDAIGLKSELKKALSARKSIRFNVVDNKEQAEYLIGGNVKDFGWSDHDPIDMIVGAAAVALDAAKVEDYAFMIGDFYLKEAKGNQTLWQGENRATITKSGMSEKDSISLINTDMADGLVRTVFGKKKN